MKNSLRRMIVKKRQEKIARARKPGQASPPPDPKVEALAALAQRTRDNKNRKHVDNSSLPAGSPMYFSCLQCNGQIVVPEDYTSRQKLCGECLELQKNGWL